MDIHSTHQAARELKDKFRSLIAGVERTPKGVRASEMFFVCSAVAPLEPKRFLESGTSGGQSTLQLALCYPEAEIISYDIVRDDKYAQKAQERLAGCPNVELRWGDTQQIFPEMVKPGDVVVIDGPKDWKAIRFAFQLLKTGNPAAIFIHDLSLGRPERRFLESHAPQAFFSDDPAFVARYSDLDSAGKEEHEKPMNEENLPEPGEPPVQPYGATFGCIPGEPAISPARCDYLIFKRGVVRICGLIPEKVLRIKKRDTGSKHEKAEF